MPYVLREHTADVAVEARADSLGGVFGAVADGMAAAMCERVPPAGERFDVETRAEDREAALFDYLDELIYQRDVRDVLPVDNRVEVDRRGDAWVVTGSARGVPLAGLGAREVKAVTYSEMALTERDGAWYAYVVLDV